MSKLGTVFAFALGAAAGTFVSWRILKSKYEKITEKEVQSVKDVYARKYADEKQEQKEIDEAIDEAWDEIDKATVKEEYSEKFQQLGYGSVTPTTDGEGDNMKKKKTEPYIISPEEFSELDDYETTTLFYYQDGVVADTNDEVVVDVAELIGLDSLDKFGEYEDDSVFVRNDNLKTDFEILLDARSFSKDVRGVR